MPDATQWANDPSFSSGRIKDLMRQDFILSTENVAHPWVNWPAAQNLIPTTADAHSPFHDNSFDVVVVKISGTEATNILMDFHGNHELSFSPGSQVNPYVSQNSQASPKMLSVSQIKKRHETLRAAS